MIPNTNCSNLKFLYSWFSFCVKSSLCACFWAVLCCQIKGVFRSFETKVINMFSRFRFRFIFFMLKSKEEGFIFQWTKTCLTSVPSRSKWVEKNHVFLRLWPRSDWKYTSIICIPSIYYRENIRLLVRYKGTLYMLFYPSTSF